MIQADVAVIGGGMAGASVAAELSPTHHVVLLEREKQPGYHTTGRSAAVYTQAYGPPQIRALTRGSLAFFTGETFGAPPPGLLTPRGELMIARQDQLDHLQAELAELADVAEQISADELRRRVPLLREGYAAGGLYVAAAQDIDVAALLAHFLRRLASGMGALRCAARVIGLSRKKRSWRIETNVGPVTAPVVVNAAGAWADEVAGLAGLAPLGLETRRRTALIVDPPPGMEISHWPLVLDAEEAFYLKPDAGRLLLSPANADPAPPSDVQPEEMDIALCIDRIQTAFDLPIRHVAHKWAGLRSFFADGEPAVGFDPRAPGFFWLAGQGGYGIQAAPALARLAASLIRDEGLPHDLALEGVKSDALSPGRLGPQV